MPRVSTVFACVSALLLVSACNSSTSPTDAATPGPVVTDTFTGTLGQGSSVVFSFTVATASSVTITLVSLTPQSTVTTGIALGTPATTGCSVSGSQENVKVGTALPTTLNPGTYCLVFYDLGNLTGPNAFTLTVQHS